MQGRQPTAEPVSDEYQKIIPTHFLPDFQSGNVLVGDKKIFMPQDYIEFSNAIENLSVRDDDIWIMSYPKAGTTWTQEMVWCIANDLDFEAAKTKLPIRFPFLEKTVLFDYRPKLKQHPEFKLPLYITNSPSYVDKMPSPRFIKTHLPWSLLPREIRNQDKKPKIIYVARSVKDNCVSYYHHYKIFKGYIGTFQQFCDYFLKDWVCFSPYWDHKLLFWSKRKEKNVLFITYEQMKENLPAVIEKTARFLNKQLTSDQIEKLADHLSFDRMKNNPSVNFEEALDLHHQLKLLDFEGKFMRKGEVGSYREIMNEDMIEKFEVWKKTHLKESDYQD